MAANVHPELLQQINGAGNRLVQGVFHLHSPDQLGNVIAPDETAKLAATVLGRVADEVGRKAARCNVLRNLGTMIVEADPEFLRSLIQQPEIMSAASNQMSESPLIPPHGKRPA